MASWRGRNSGESERGTTVSQRRKPRDYSASNTPENTLLRPVALSVRRQLDNTFLQHCNVGLTTRVRPCGRPLPDWAIVTDRAS